MRDATGCACVLWAEWWRAFLSAGVVCRMRRKRGTKLCRRPPVLNGMLNSSTDSCGGKGERGKKHDHHTVRRTTTQPVVRTRLSDGGAEPVWFEQVGTAVLMVRVEAWR